MDAAGTHAAMEPTIRRRPAGPPAARVRPAPGGVGRRSSRDAERVSDALRRQSGDYLGQRRVVAALTTGAAAALGVVGLYQFGVLPGVPEPPLPGLDADAVDASGEAYALFSTPDSALGLASYGVTLALVGMGAGDRWRSRPLVPLLAAAKVIVDAAGAGYLFAEQITKHRRLCSWCTLAALLSAASVPAVLPEARAAWGALRGRRGRR